MEVILQNLLFPGEENCGVPALYYHAGGEGALDLDGYFNLFYIEKHRKYTAIEALSLHLRVRGYVRAVLMHDREEIGAQTLVGGACKEARLAFPYDRYDAGVFWLRLIADPAVPEKERTVQGYFSGSMENARAARIAVTICTYRREDYVLKNMRKLLALFARDPSLAAHYHVFLVDNGRTLAEREDMRELLDRADGRVELIPNRNTGGAGGFRRGMEEAIRKKKALGLTNLLLLDDDAVFDPDLFVRLCGALVSMREAYRDMTIGGAMWLEDMPYIQHASGECFHRFSVINPHPSLDLRHYENCVRMSMTAAEEKSGLYSGWWCCCYSMAVIRTENLPLPLFLHGDDIQFGLKHADQGILFLNGIGVWHRSFELSFPGVKEYYNTRNFLMTTVLFDRAVTRKIILRWMVRQLSGPLLSFRYAELQLAYRGIADFLRGPDWLLAVDTEKLHEEIAGAYREKLQMQPLTRLMDRETYEAFAARYLSEEAKMRAIAAFHQRGKRKGSLWQYLTLNGWLLPAKKETGVFCIADVPWDLYRVKKALLYEPDTARGFYAVRKRGEMLRAAAMVLRLGVKILVEFPKTAAKWRETVHSV